MIFNKVAIIGPGLLGGSICKGLREINSGIRIDVYARNPQTIRKAAEDGYVDRVDAIQNCDLTGVDLAVIATPIIPSLALITNLLNRPDLGSGALVIDVGSVKGAVVCHAEKQKNAARFIGCHPMAGSEKMGFDHSSAGLYRGSTVIVTPHAKNARADIAVIAAFWEALGARVVETAADEHDAIVARTSHLPHLLACALVDVVRERNCEDVQSFIGNGFRDVTRISMGSADMWADILRTNTGHVRAALAAYAAKLDEIARLLDRVETAPDDLRRFFNAVKNYREKIN